MADVSQIFATLLSTVWNRYKHLLEPIKEKIKEYKKRKAEQRKMERMRDEGADFADDESEDEDENGEGTVFKNHPKCRILNFWHFSPIFGYLKKLKVTSMVTLSDLDSSKMSYLNFFGVFHQFLAT